MQMQPPSPFADVKVRQAVNLALDRDEIIRTLADGKGAWALAGACSRTRSHTDQEVHQILKYDPEQAKQLLAQAGLANGLNVEFLYPGKSYGEGYISLMQLMQAQWAKVGINVSFKSAESGEFNDIRFKGNYQMAAGGTIGVFRADVDSYLFGAFHSSSQNAVQHANDPTLDQLVEAQRTEARTPPSGKRRMSGNAVKYIPTTTSWAWSPRYFTGGPLRATITSRNFFPQLG